MNDDLLDNVSKLSMEYGSKISLCATVELFGILHGGTEVFDLYIHYCSKHPYDKSLRGSNNHSTAGGKFI